MITSYNHHFYFKVYVAKLETEREGSRNTYWAKFQTKDITTDHVPQYAIS